MTLYALFGFGVIMTAAFVRNVKDKYEDFCIGVALPIFLILLLPLGELTGWLRPTTLDSSFRQIDLTLGLDGFSLTRWLIKTGWYALVSPVYYALPLMLASGWALERSRLLLRASVIGPLLAFPIYLVAPAAGPEYAFANFPDASAAATQVGWVHPRNCFPSMHLTWALVLALNMRDRRWKWIFFLYAGAMSIATVASGEHYFIDVIAAVPFTLAVQRLSIWSVTCRMNVRSLAFRARSVLAKSA